MRIYKEIRNTKRGACTRLHDKHHNFYNIPRSKRAPSALYIHTIHIIAAKRHLQRRQRRQHDNHSLRGRHKHHSIHEHLYINRQYGEQQPAERPSPHTITTPINTPPGPLPPTRQPTTLQSQHTRTTTFARQESPRGLDWKSAGTSVYARR